MKRNLIFICSLVIVFTLTSAYIIKYAAGHAGAANSPGENNCAQCHTAGSFTTAFNVGFIPSITGNTFIPGQTYTVDISTVFAGVGFGAQPMGIGCEILDGISVTSSNSGVITNTILNTKIVTASNGRTNITQPFPTGGVNISSLKGFEWTFIWTAPIIADSAIVYFSSVKGPADSNPANDAVANYSLVLTKNTTTNIQNPGNKIISLSVFPNPVTDNFKLSYLLQNNSEVKIELTDLQGKQIAIISEGNQNKGVHTLKYDLPDIEKGVYFIKLTLNDKTETSRLIIVQ